MEMLKKVSAMTARKSFGQIMSEVSIKADEYIIERAGKPLVVMIPFEEYQSLKTERERFWKTYDEIQSQTKDTNPKEIDDAIEEATQSYRNNYKVK